MTDRITKTQRWLDLIALLLERHLPQTVEQIMEGVPAYADRWSSGDATARASVRRTFERDKDELKRLGIPIEIVPFTVHYQPYEGYRLTRRDFYLPYLRIVSGGSTPDDPPAPRGYSGLRRVELDPDEASLAMEALRRIAETPGFPFAGEARSALGKLTFDLDPSHYPAAPVVRVDRPGAREVLERLNVLSDALLARKRVRFTYRGIRRDEPTERDVAPYGLFLHHDWYLVGHDALRDAIRVFRVSRIDDPRPNARRPKERDYEIPEEFDLDAYLGRRPWELTDERPVEAEVRFRFPASVLVDRSGEGELVREDDDGSSLRRFTVNDDNPFLRWVLGFAGEAEVVAPPELRKSFRSMAAAVVARYEDRDG